VYDLFVGGMVTVLAAIARETGAIEMRQAGGKAQTRGRRGRHETGACGDAIIIERLYSPAEEIIIERLGFDQHGCQESREGFVREKPRHQIEWLVHQAEAVEDNRVDDIARGHEPRVWMWSGYAVNDLTHAECLAPTRDKAHMV